MVQMKVIFLDRDGTINKLFWKKYIDDPKNVELLPFVKEVLTKLRKKYKLVLVTNQTWIWAGYYTYDDFLAVTAEIQKQLWFKFDAIYACCHHPNEACTCRKPNIGMFLQAQKDLGPIDWKKSWMIGDSCKDMQAGKKMWLNTILIWNDCKSDYQVNWWNKILKIIEKNGEDSWSKNRRNK